MTSRGLERYVPAMKPLAFDLSSLARLSLDDAALDRLIDDSAIVLFGGMAKERPYPGSTTVSTVNGGVVGLVRTLSSELAPIRVNAIHPGFVIDSPYWSGKDMDRHTKRTLTGQLPVMAEIVDAVRFLLENRSVNDTNLFVDGGWRPTD